VDFAAERAQQVMGKAPVVGETFQTGSTRWQVGKVGQDTVTMQIEVDKGSIAFEKLAVGTDGRATLTITHPGQPPQTMGLRQLPAGAGRLLVDDTPLSSTVYRFRLGQGPTAPEVEVAIPNRTNGKPDSNLIKDIQEMLANLPKEHADAQGYIRINRNDNVMDLYWRQIGQFGTSGKSAATAGPGSITPSGHTARVTDFYPTSTSSTTRFSERLNTFWHETGHHIARKLWGRPDAVPAQEWVRVMNADAKFVSDYAQSNAAEDFAEVVAAYLQSDAGRLDASLRSQFQHRFELLDRVFGVDSHLAEVHAAMQQSMRRLRIGIVGTAGASATGLVLLDRSRRHSQPPTQTAAVSNMP
jgi:hypothetical protein